MKKKLFYLFSVTALFVFCVTFYKTVLKPKETIAPTSQPKVLGVPSEGNKPLELEIKGEKIAVSWFVVDDATDIFLYANSEKLTSKDFAEKEKCRYLTNGGYYKADYSPTGLLISEYEEKFPFVISKTANGIFSVNDFETPRITTDIPQDRLRLVLQAGPILKENGSKKVLKLISDEDDRRIVVGVTGDNTTVFLVFYNPESVYKGQSLGNLPDLVEKFEQASGITLADALNLDGGTASSFYSDEINLPEATFSGSFFCIK